jgi:hypothetical protein
MTIGSRLIALFPAAIIAGAFTCFGWMCVAPGPLPPLALLAVLYLVPVLAFRIHQALWPLKMGITNLAEKRYAPWWGAHQIQLVYLAFPALERLLRLIPGLFSLWLRLWGSRVGRGVYFTPDIDIGDRNLLDIGDHVIFGQRATLYGHVITPKKGKLLLYVKPVCIGTGAFVGAGTVFGPGARVYDGVMVAADTRVFPNQEVK